MEQRAVARGCEEPILLRVDAGQDREIGEVLIEEASRAGADLLVMGAYGHWRWREWVFGGATLHVLRHTTVPVLMTH